MYTLQYERVIQAPPDVVWAVISDVERYAEYAPNLSKAVKTSDSTTPTRTCWDTDGRSWNEACVMWEEGEGYAYLVDTTPGDYPYPVTQLKGTWTMQPRQDGVLVTMRFDMTFKYPVPIAWLLFRLGARGFYKTIAELMDNWEAEMLKRARLRRAA
ncbi:MAG: hypothetical protein CUN54_08590 [Phototrophicales bacterium]|nr:MAG: hypothetical protein CUN54_08590 [Phototrophicales bacterium]